MTSVTLKTSCSILNMWDKFKVIYRLCFVALSKLRIRRDQNFILQYVMLIFKAFISNVRIFSALFLRVNCFWIQNIDGIVFLFKRGSVVCTINMARKDWTVAGGDIPHLTRTMISATTASPLHSEIRRRCSENSSVALRLANYLLVNIAKCNSSCAFHVLFQIIICLHTKLRPIYNSRPI